MSCQYPLSIDSLRQQACWGEPRSHGCVFENRGRRCAGVSATLSILLELFANIRWGDCNFQIFVLRIVNEDVLRWASLAGVRWEACICKTKWYIFNATRISTVPFQFTRKRFMYVCVLKLVSLSQVVWTADSREGYHPKFELFQLSAFCHHASSPSPAHPAGTCDTQREESEEEGPN